MIRKALEAYRAETGRYPRTLEALVPRQLVQIAPPVAGERQWLYAVSPSGQFYNLSFRGLGQQPPFYGTSAGKKGWGFVEGA